jgi:hypothetical protein
MFMVSERIDWNADFHLPQKIPAIRIASHGNLMAAPISQPPEMTIVCYGLPPLGMPFGPMLSCRIYARMLGSGSVPMYVPFGCLMMNCSSRGL